MEDPPRVEAHKPKIKKIGFALGYALSSMLLMSVTKVVLTGYKFPSPTVIVVGQMLTTVIILFLAKSFKFIHFPDMCKTTFTKLHPLPLIYLANAVTGLGGTKALSLPMFTALRRITIVLTMIFEYYLLDVRASSGIKASVFIMIVGAFIAAVNDFTVTLNGYALVMLNNLFTAVNGVVTKKKLSTTEFGPFGIMYYNALYMLLPAVVAAYVIGDMDKVMEFGDYGSVLFWVSMFFCCTLGYVLVWTVVECTNYNSSLTTCIVGTVKNMVISYAGMFIGGDYVYEFYSFVGINISIAGSVMYTAIVASSR